MYFAAKLTKGTPLTESKSLAAFVRPKRASPARSSTSKPLVANLYDGEWYVSRASLCARGTQRSTSAVCVAFMMYLLFLGAKCPCNCECLKFCSAGDTISVYARPLLRDRPIWVWDRPAGNWSIPELQVHRLVHRAHPHQRCRHIQWQRNHHPLLHLTVQLPHIIIHRPLPAILHTLHLLILHFLFLVHPLPRFHQFSRLPFRLLSRLHRRLQHLAWHLFHHPDHPIQAIHRLCVGLLPPRVRLMCHLQAPSLPARLVCPTHLHPTQDLFNRLHSVSPSQSVRDHR